MDSSDPTLSSLLTTVPLLPIETIDSPFPLTPSSDSDSSSGEEKEDDDEEKKYFCQRCLNHDLHFPRKGHKSVCSYGSCQCPACAMVEQRRQLNNMISKKKVIHFPSEIIDGKKVRDPKCARCYAHGVFSRLRGHKKDQCMFMHCNCEACQLVDTRRELMARQIRLRRNQRKSMQCGGIVKGGIRKGNTRLPSMNCRNNSPSVPLIRPIPIVPPSSIASLSPSINSISPTLSNSSFSSLDPSPPPLPQLFNLLPQLSSSFITLSLPSSILLPSLTPAALQYLLHFQALHNVSLNILPQ